MKWILLAFIVLVFLPFYTYILAKCVEWGRMVARYKLNHDKEELHGTKEQEEDQSV